MWNKKASAICGLVSAVMMMAFAGPAFANTQKVVSAQAKISAMWMDYGKRPTFSDLEQLGVERAAEKGALSKCMQEGLIDCVILSSTITACNESDPHAYREYFCEAIAHARGTSIQ